MGEYRELVYGVCFFVFAMAGAFVIGPFTMPFLFEPTDDFDKFRIQAFIGLGIGACVGGGIWLGLKAGFLTRRRK
jgi:hypothetical protein